MNRRSSFSLPRALCAMVMLLSWLTISNHCALGSLVKEGQNAQTHERCCGSATPQNSGKAPGSDTRECCKTLHSLPTATPAKIAKLAADPLTIPLAWALMVDALHTQPMPGGERMDGTPPRARSFAEVVLQRSLLSHAPPSVA